MSHPSRYCSGVCSARARWIILVVALFVSALETINAQENKYNDYDHDHLHFSHPLVTESPSPDTKFRVDYFSIRTSDVIAVRENTYRLEGEYAFNHNLSLSIVAPFVQTRPISEST